MQTRLQDSPLHPCSPQEAPRALPWAPTRRQQQPGPPQAGHGRLEGRGPSSRGPGPLTRTAATVKGPAAAAAAPQALPELAPLDGEYEAAHRFSAKANWLVPGRLLLGRYPYADPSRRSREEGEANLRQLLGAGVTTFICLQAELPPQQRVPVGGVGGFLPYLPAATLLAAAAGPPPSEEVTGLRNRYLDSFLPPRKARRGVAEGGPEAPAQLLQFLHYPITDLSIPTPQLAREAAAEIEKRVQKGETVFLHCWGGRGRAGTIGACFLRAAYGLGAEEALERVQRAYATRGELAYRSPETSQQLDFVRGFVA